MNTWLVASYKINEQKILELNLRNQNFNYYLPKILIRKLNNKFKEEVLFPGYIFINSSSENYSALKFTRGIKNLIKFGKNISVIDNDEIDNIRLIEEQSKTHPVELNLSLGQEAYIKRGSFKGSIVKICSLPAKKRVEILIYILGSKRRINIATEDLSLS